MAEGRRWWISPDRESWFPADDAATRRGAIAAGRGQYGYDAFYICMAARGEFDLKIPDWRLIELLDLINEDRVDPDGDGSIFSRDLTKEECADLESRVSATIKGWARETGVLAQAWAFAEQRDEERIPPARDYPPDIREHYHALVASMGRPQ